MARPVSLTDRLLWMGLALSAWVASPAPVWGQQTMMTVPPLPSTNAPAAVAPPKTPIPSATNAVLVPIPDTYGRYGKILIPGDEMMHPLRLKMPFPGVGEVKVPNQDEVNMREKLEQLSRLSDDEIRTQLAQWPAYNHMSLRDEGTMLSRIQDFRDYHTKLAQQKAHDMGLLTMNDQQKARFEKEYWDKKLQMDHDLSKQFTPIFKARQQKLEDELYREFSSAASGPIAQIPKPPAPKPLAAPMPNKQAFPTPTVGQSQPAVTNVMLPVASGPK